MSNILNKNNYHLQVNLESSSIREDRQCCFHVNDVSNGIFCATQLVRWQMQLKAE